MPVLPAPGEQYTVRKKIFKILGEAFHVYGTQGELVAYCKLKAFKLREDIRFYTDESRTKELLAIGARNIIDLSATYDVKLPTGEVIGSIKQHSFKSMLRDEWSFLDSQGEPVALMREDSSGAALARRFLPLVAMLKPQKLMIRTNDDQHIATLRAHANPFVYRLGVAIHEEHPEIDELVILAAACLYAAIEGRQSNDG